jgi:saccharopine dehydrogenase-like NADP-dependent oxidoreductase
VSNQQDPAYKKILLIFFIFLNYLRNNAFEGRLNPKFMVSFRLSRYKKGFFMHRVLVVGAGKIGSLIATLLAHSNDYKIFLSDINIDAPHLKRLFEKTNHLELVKLDAETPQMVAEFLRKNPVETIVSSLPYYCNIAIAKIAKEFNLNYFDLTEDTLTANTVTELSKNANSAFVPQCGLAPGFISIVANQLMQHFPTLDIVKMRVGALPINISNALQYSLTWSTDGLINEYGNLCQAIMNGKEVNLFPLDDLEEIKIDGLTYEAFNTSGGIGSLAASYMDRVKSISYKTIRYPGHCEKMRFLMNDLKLNDDRETLKRILEHSIPKTSQDVVLVYVSVTGTQDTLYSEENYVKKFYPKKIGNTYWSAIQLTTASALCAVLDMVVTQPGKFRGLVKQEQFSLDDVTNNRFGQYYA